MELRREWIEAADTLPVTIFTARPDGTIEFVNRRWQEMSGIRPGEVLEEAWMKIVHPDDLGQTAAVYFDAITSGKPFSIDLRARAPAGTYRWYRSQAEPMRAADGSIMRWFGTVLDIDDAHRAQERFRVLSESLPVIVWSADAEGWIDWYNPRWYEYTGQTYEDARGWGWQAAHHPDDFPEVMRQWPHSLATGKPFEMEFRLRGRDGSFRWFLTRVAPLRDESGRIVRWYGSNVDIEEHKRALERTKRIAETLQDVFLPKVLPCDDSLSIDAAYIAAERDALVGGDWYDAFALPDGTVIFSIGDIAGHGLEASVLVGRLRQVIFTLAFRGLKPGAILEETNRLLHFQYPEIFVTALVGALTPARDAAMFASAGHPAPIHVSRGEARLLRQASNPPLGVQPRAHYDDEYLKVQAKDVLVLYTDGMTEFGRDIDKGEERMLAAASVLALDSFVERPAKAIQDMVFDHAGTSDDAAILVLRFAPPAKPAAGAARPAEGAKSWRFHSSHAFSAHTARREIVNYLRRFAASEEGMFESELIAGELLANTVQHAPGLVEVRIDWSGEHAVMTVCDSGNGMVRANNAAPRDALDESGRGLFLAQTLSADFAVRPSPGFGSEVCVTLPLRRRLRPSQASPNNSV